jgi:hypothetical protein
LAIAVAFTIGVTCAESYARLAAPYYWAVTTLIATAHPWRVTNIEVTPDSKMHGSVLRLTGEVRRHRDDPAPAAIVVGRVQVGEAIETPVVFWTLVLMWPARTGQQRLARIALAIPVFLALEAMTTACQLIYSMADASAVLAGENDPLTLWERWSRFLEAGGRFVLEVTGAVLVVAAIKGTETTNVPLTISSNREGE